MNKVIYSILEEEHKKTKSKMDEAEKKKSKELLTSISKDLLAHMSAEEAAYYSFIMKIKIMKDLVLEAEEEHLVVKTIIQQIKQGKIHDDVLWAKFKVLKENVEHHVKEQENTLFEETRRNITESEAKDIGEKFLEQKKKYENVN